MNLTDRFAGSLLGLALADALGAPYEGGILERLAWKAITLTRPGKLLYTDDTDMTLGSADSLVRCEGFDVNDMAMTWARRASAGRGYGGGAIRCLRLIRDGMPWNQANTHVYPDGSYGNGAAMRVAPLALWLHDQPERLRQTVELASSVTHAHPLGIQGAQLIAQAVAAALTADDAEAMFARATQGAWDTPLAQRLRLASGMLGGEPDHTAAAESLGNGIVAHESVVTALLIAAWFYDRPFEELMGFTISVGGDVDTIGAMAGGIWGAHRGRQPLPAEPLQRLEDRERLESLATGLTKLASTRDRPAS
jgi:poly(ADP-ribose) glycohydrolase ARH3